MLFLASTLSCAALSKRAAKPETCEPNYRDVNFHCSTGFTRAFDARIDADYVLIHLQQLGDYMGTCR